MKKTFEALGFKRVDEALETGRFTPPKNKLRSGDVTVGLLTREERAMFTACSDLVNEISRRSGRMLGILVLPYLKAELRQYHSLLCETVAFRLGAGRHLELREGFRIVEVPRPEQLLVEMVFASVSDEEGFSSITFSSQAVFMSDARGDCSTCDQVGCPLRV